MLESFVGANCEIRPVRAGDADGLLALMNAQMRAVPALMPDTIRRKIEGEDQNAFRLVAHVAGEIIAQAALSFGFEPAPTIGRLTILVREDRRGHGMGTELLASLLSQAEGQLGLTRIELSVFADNRPAIRLYRNFGFEMEARHINAEGREILSMARSIRPKACEPKDGPARPSTHIMDSRKMSAERLNASLFIA